MEGVGEHRRHALRMEEGGGRRGDWRGGDAEGRRQGEHARLKGAVHKTTGE